MAFFLAITRVVAPMAVFVAVGVGSEERMVMTVGLAVMPLTAVVSE